MNRNNFISWLNAAATKTGWGAAPKDIEYHEYTISSLIALKLLGAPVKNAEYIVEKAYMELSRCMTTKADDNYYILRTIKNSIEKLMLLDCPPPDIEIQNKIMKFYKNGGFGSRVSYMYAAYWAIRSLYLIDKYRKYNAESHVSQLQKIRCLTILWINSCQNPDGGFGPTPREPSNLQSTYCAHYSLWMLGGKPKYSNGRDWILSLMKTDGGFGGSIDMGSEMLHILYAVGSLAILEK
jgi:prenyltransferase beta subunit